MKLAAAFQNLTWDQVKSALDGGALKIYSVARPANPDTPVTRSGLLATFGFASPAFSAAAPPELGGAAIVVNPVLPERVGTPGFARAYGADGVTPIADFSVGPGGAEIRLSKIATTPGYPISLIRFRLGNGAG